MASWEARWSSLGAASREAFLALVRQSSGRDGDTQRLFADGIVHILKQGDFIQVQGDKIALAEQVRPFALRLLILSMSRLLSTEPDVHLFVLNSYDQRPFLEECQRLYAREKGIEGPLYAPVPFVEMVQEPEWATWVLRDLKDPIAQALYEAFRKADRAIPLREVPKLLPGSHSNGVRPALEQLFKRLVVVEDLDSATHELMVGLFHPVRNPLTAQAPPPLPSPQVPKVTSPLHGEMLEDIQAVLMELSSGEVRLKQTGELYVRDHERLQAVLQPFLDTHHEHLEERLSHRAVGALDHCRNLGLVRTRNQGSSRLVSVDPAKTQEWHAKPHADRLWLLFDRFRREPSGSQLIVGDGEFLGVELLVHRLGPKEKYPRSAYDMRGRPPFQPLRDAVLRALERLPLGQFFPYKQVAQHLAAVENPLTLGQESLDRIVVVIDGQIQYVTPLVLRNRAVYLLERLLASVLVPRGAMQGGLDEEDELLVARTPYTALYFNPHAAIGTPTPEATAATRVVIQPDFTVLVFGLDAAPAAELALFAERDRSSLTPGSFTFRITKESVVRAVRQGQSAEQMIECLRTRSNLPVPANVEKQIETWAGQIHRVERRSMTVYQCQSSEAADKLVGLLGTKAVRLGPNAVGTPTAKLTTSQITKLTAAGIFVDERTSEMGDD